MFENMTNFWEWYLFTVVYGYVVYFMGRKDGKKSADRQLRK